MVDLRELLAENPTVEFETMLHQTGAGSKCTACLLNLEYHYTEMQKGNEVFRKSFFKQRLTKKKSIKRKCFDFIDSICPMLRSNLSNTMPVIYGPGISQSVIVANDASFYDKHKKPETVTVELKVRNSQGKRIYRENFSVDTLSPLDVVVSDFLANEPVISDDIPLAIGSVEVRRWWDRPTVRGTTRPQVVIDGPDGCGGVHTQGARARGETFYTTLFRPADDRTFISYNNCSNRPININLSYPHLREKVSECELLFRKETIPAYGARFYEIVIPTEFGNLEEETAFNIRCQSDGPYKALIFSAPPNLTNFSVDHPDSS